MILFRFLKFFKPSRIILGFLIRGGQMAQRRKSAIMAIVLHSKHKKSYQGTLGTQELPPIGSMTSHGPSLGPTGSFKRTL